VDTYDDIIRIEFIWLALEFLWTESFAVEVLDENIRPNDEYNIIKGTVVTYLSMLSTQDIRVEIAVILRDSACISLSTDLDTLGIH
jgi:hypothetical protein